MSVNLAGLASVHKEALDWFRKQAGQRVQWPDPLRGMFLVNKAKGIQKPAGMEYALSIRQSLNGPYEDKVQTLPDGSWEFRYAQEGTDPDFFTNKGLFACMRDGMPVGVLLQASTAPQPTYHVLGLGQVVAWDKGFFTICEYKPFSSIITNASLRDFTFAETGDLRIRTLQSIAARRGQPSFRKALIHAYGGRCAVTGCGVLETLEAAHIMPYRGTHTNHVQNGLLLRSDVHTLFDLGLVKVDPEKMVVQFTRQIALGGYAEYDGKELRLPISEEDRPSRGALRTRFNAKDFP